MPAAHTRFGSSINPERYVGYLLRTRLATTKQQAIDISEDAFSRMQMSKATGTIIGNEASYYKQCLHTSACDAARARRTAASRCTEALGDRDVASPQEQSGSRDTLEVFYSALMELSARHRDLVLLHGVKEFTFREIAAIHTTATGRNTSAPTLCREWAEARAAFVAAFNRLSGDEVGECQLPPPPRPTAAVIPRVVRLPDAIGTRQAA